jgi:ABC-type dipeptide/oligopeptide/nickel transport system ATPase component
MSEPVLEIRGLKTHFYTRRGVAKAVDGVNLTLERQRTLGVVGESGCGKSVMALSILRLIPMPPGRIVAGEILFNGRDLVKVSQEEIKHIRGNDISMIFQEPMTSLNPVFTVGFQIEEVLRKHRGMSKKKARNGAMEALGLVGIPEPAARANDYPHQMSGGMRQRVMIAMALSCQPQIMIADEPSTALDVTIQAQILDLIHRLQKKIGMSVLLITHDLGVIAETCQKVVVMYAGKVVEWAEVTELFAHPCHPYTIGLFERCFKAEADCRGMLPPWSEILPGHWVRCWHPLE